MEILDPGLLKLLPQLQKGQNISLQLPKNFPPQLLNTVQKLVVLSQLPENSVLLKLINGKEIKAKLEPSLPIGTRITLLAKSPTEVMIRQLLPPLAEKPPQPQQQPLAPNSRIPAQVRTLTFPQQQLLPITFKLPPQIPSLPTATIFTATVLTPPTQQGQQIFQITLPPPTTPSTAIPASSQPTTANPLPQQPIKITVEATPPSPLPVKTTLTITQPPSGSPQITSLTLPQPTNTSQNTPTVSLNAPQITSFSPENVQISIPPQAAQNLPKNQEITLNIQEGKLPLPNGQQAIVKSPQPLPEGTAMTIRITSNGLPQVLKITGDVSHHHQPQSQTNQQQNTQQSHTPLLTPGQTFRGIITAQAPHNQMILTLNSGHTVQVHADKPLPTGTQVTITIQADGEAQIQDLSLPTGSTRADTAYRFSKEWTLLKQSLTALKNSHPEAAAKLANSLPKVDALAPTLLQFANALQTQSVEKLLGDDTANLLRALGIDLTPEIQSLNQLQQKPETQDGWRSLLFPYVENEGEDPQQGGFFWRRQNTDEQEEQSSLRFILQLRLSQFGAMQLDGLMNKESLHLKLYLSTQPSPEFQKELSEIVEEKLTAYGLTGGIQIHTTTQFPTDPLTEIQHYAGHMNLTT
ncbi:MAG: hypothetical protein OXR68_04730 [Alphaproteobacteria bacterium]|nr:hypothetical protein [Alphaproteobacteria bacterium]MDD9919914.1 hypothetical protein [Alphaproteobacteria bacterium]